MLLKGLFLYAAAPFLCVLFLREPIGRAARESDAAAFGILFAALACVCLNWGVYVLIHRKRPSLPVFAYGVFCLLLTVILESEALPGSVSLASTLAVIGGCLLLLFLFLLSFWFAARPSRPEHAIAVGLRIIIGLIAFFMAYQVFRDFESRTVNRDTWISVAILAALIPAAFIRKIISAVRRAAARRRAVGLTTGRITQIVGETHLDLDGDAVTDYHVLIQYTVDDISYETRADIHKLTMRWFGREAFIGREVPVHYNPDHPGEAFVNRIDRHFFDQDESNDNPEDSNPHTI